MLAILPTAAFADDETGTASNKTLSITADGKPDVTGIVPTIDNGKKVYTGDSWKYEIHPNQDYLFLDKGYSFNLTNEPAVKCYRVENYGEIQGGVFDPCNWVHSLTGIHSGYVENFGTISGGIFLSDVYAITNSGGKIYTPKITGGIFANDPRTENFQLEKNVYTLAVTDGLKIVTIQHDNQSVAVFLDKIFVLADTVTESKPLTLTLRDGTS